MTHWTVSRLKDFETCPKRYEYSYIQREGGLASPAADRGTQVHEQIEKFLLGLTDSLPVEVSPAWAIQIRDLKRRKAIPEQMWEFAEGWFQPDKEHPMWMRGKIDAHYWPKLHVLTIIDFKTGKPYKQNIEQLEVYAVMAFALHDDVDTVHVALWYLDSEEPHEKTFKRAQVAKLARKWEGRARPLLEATAYPAKPGNHCGWCPFRKVCPDAA